MSGAHVHLLLTHIPVLGILFGFLILAYGRFRPSPDSVRIGLGMFVLSGLAAGAVYLTGEAAEEVVENLAEVSHAVIERHEEAAFIALIASGMLGLTSLIGLWISRKRTVPGWFSTGTLVLAAAITVIMAWTANLGGQINHPEIRPESAQIEASEHTSSSAAEISDQD